MGHAARKVGSSPDPTIYPVSDDMGENCFETFVRLLLQPLMQRWLRTQGKEHFVGSNQFIYWEQFNSQRCVAPDLYVVPGIEPETEFGCLKTWDYEGKKGVPSFALELVSENKAKDYVLGPVRYAELGIRELIIYDPDFARRREGHRWQVYRRVPKQGFLLRTITNEDRVRSTVLGGWLRAVPYRSSERLRIATRPRGDELFPTEEELHEQREAELRRAAEREKGELVAQIDALHAEMATLKQKR